MAYFENKSPFPCSPLRRTGEVLSSIGFQVRAERLESLEVAKAMRNRHRTVTALTSASTRSATRHAPRAASPAGRASLRVASLPAPPIHGVGQRPVPPGRLPPPGFRCLLPPVSLCDPEAPYFHSRLNSAHRCPGRSSLLVGARAIACLRRQ